MALRACLDFLLRRILSFFCVLFSLFSGTSSCSKLYATHKFLPNWLYILRLLRASKLCRINSLILRIQFSCTLRDGL